MAIQYDKKYTETFISKEQLGHILVCSSQVSEEGMTYLGMQSFIHFAKGLDQE
jgi:hypothetical protein